MVSLEAGCNERSGDDSRSDPLRVITSFQEITADWLTSLLQRVDSSIGRVTAVEFDTGDTTFCMKAHLRPTYDELPGPAGLFVKFSKPHHPVTTPEEGREVLFYRHIAPATRVPSLVRCYEALYDPDRHRLHLVLEDVRETHHAEPASQLPLTAGVSQDDVLRANDGGFIGLGSNY